MALREIDRFGQKPEGFLANWRYCRVMIDELGNLSVLPVPNEEFPNLDCITNYKKNDRKFKSSGSTSPKKDPATGADLITEFCDLATYTNYRIYAQLCKPYAYVQQDLNAPKCGYLEPLPEPAVPFNPFGNPAYGLFAYHNYCDNKNIPIAVRIFKRNYEGDAINLVNSGATPVILSYKNTDENKLNPIRALELQLTFTATGAEDIDQFTAQDEREFKITVAKNGINKFLGFCTAENASEEFIAFPYDVTLRATDGIGGLKDVAYPLPIGSRTDIQQKFIDILAYCLAMTNLNLNIVTACNLYESKMLTSLDDDPLAQATVNPLRMSEKGVVYDCYKVLETICNQFGAFLVQDNGVWNFVRQSELANPIIRRRWYNTTGLFLYAEQYQNKRLATCKGDDISMLDDNPMLRGGNGYKRAEVIINYGEVPFLIYNGDFELYNGSNFLGWTKYGGIKVSRVEKLIKTTTGMIPSGTYALQFDELANNGKYIEAAKILTTKGDKINFSYNVGDTGPIGYTPGIRGATSAGVSAFKFRVKLENYYLTNLVDVDGNMSYQWVTQLVTVTNPVSNSGGSTDLYQVTFDFPEAPISGEMIIELFGFTQNTPSTYYPVQVDNFTLTRSSENKVISRILYINQQDAFYTNKPEPTNLLFGDYAGDDTTVRPSRANDISGASGAVTIKNDFYAIRTKDGSYSTGWYEFGAATSVVPIGLTLARTILKAYQKPFKFLEGSFLGDNISYLDIINVYLPNDANFINRTFALLSGDLDLGTGELNNANYVEIFEKPGKSVDIITPGKDGDPMPPMQQNPNAGEQALDGIFTIEFTNVFT